MQLFPQIPLLIKPLFKLLPQSSCCYWIVDVLLNLTSAFLLFGIICTLIIALFVVFNSTFLLLSAVFVQLWPDRISMAEDAQSRVQAAVKSFVNDVDRTHLRTLVKQHNTLPNSAFKMTIWAWWGSRQSKRIKIKFLDMSRNFFKC